MAGPDGGAICFVIITFACLSVLLFWTIWQQVEIADLKNQTTTTTTAASTTTAPLGHGTAAPSAFGLARKPKAFAPQRKAETPASTLPADDLAEKRKRAEAPTAAVVPGKPKRISFPPRDVAPKTADNNAAEKIDTPNKPAIGKGLRAKQQNDATHSDRTEQERAERSALAMAETEKKHKQTLVQKPAVAAAAEAEKKALAQKPVVVPAEAEKKAVVQKPVVAPAEAEKKAAVQKPVIGSAQQEKQLAKPAVRTTAPSVAQQSAPTELRKRAQSLQERVRAHVAGLKAHE